MKNKRYGLFVALWGAAAAVSRMAYGLAGKQKVSDAYEYFADAAVRLWENGIRMDSGLAYVYTKSLSMLLRFTGNRMEAVCVYQAILQILWMFLLLAGITLLLGRLAGMATAVMISALPVVIGSIKVISPENFFMLHLSVLLVLLGVFFVKTKEIGRMGKGTEGIYLLLTGCYLGVVCIWNYLGFFLLAAVLFIRLGNRHVRMVLFFDGMIAGMAATFLKYTGITGETFRGQLQWWFHQFSAWPGRCQDFSPRFAGAVLWAVAAGISLKLLAGGRKFYVRKKQEQKNREKTAMDGREGGYVITEDGREIKLLDNPLPIPKKHIKREMEFDIEIPEDDDFDF